MQRHYYNLKLLKPFLVASEQGFKEINRLISKRLSNIYLGKSYPAGNYMFKVNNRNTRTRCEICSKLTIKTPERRH